jgi:putative Holliday junction resolvase
MRIMAVDYGDARTGLAVSDPTASLVGEAWVFCGKSPEEAAQNIASEAAARGVDRIVVGYPKNMNGTIGPRAEKCEQLAEFVRGACGVEVVLWDERMTTISASRILDETGRHGKKRKKIIDAVAASMILESYLNSL